MMDQEKLDFLINNFRKLDESRKDYIRELTRKLVEINCGGGFQGEVGEKNSVPDKNWMIYPV
ncbi:MAG: hypothetical protein LBQ93_11200 [Treponema sp.]|jgi:hypothetical protein|nr:hypothetical protein [Treponema sp.]